MAQENPPPNEPKQAVPSPEDDKKPETPEPVVFKDFASI